MDHFNLESRYKSTIYLPKYSPLVFARAFELFWGLDGKTPKTSVQVLEPKSSNTPLLDPLNPNFTLLIPATKEVEGFRVNFTLRYAKLNRLTDSKAHYCIEHDSKAHYCIEHNTDSAFFVYFLLEYSKLLNGRMSVKSISRKNEQLLIQKALNNHIKGCFLFDSRKATRENFFTAFNLEELDRRFKSLNFWTCFHIYKACTIIRFITIIQNL